MSAVAPEMTAIEPESPRYACDLLFLHGLWSGPALWTAVAAGLAHRGWRCLSLDLRAATGAAPGARGLSVWLETARAAVRSLDASPVVIGHDVGGLIALALAAQGVPRAAIAVAPLLDGAATLVSGPRRLLARWLNVPVEPPPPDHAAFARLKPESRDRLRARLQAEEGSSVASLRDPALLPQEPAVPTLLVAQRDDPVVSPFLVQLSARGIGAESLTLPGGHWPMMEEPVDLWTTQIHRWIIRRAGGSVLLLRGDEDLRDE